MIKVSIGFLVEYFFSICYNIYMENQEKKLDLKEIIAKNIIKYRKELGLTQLELAEKLNYSDKTLSKWERAESVPDVATLKQLAELFNVSVDILISEENTVTPFVPLPKKKKGISKKNIIAISLISVAIVWLVALIVFMFVKALQIDFENKWLIFIYAIPATMIVLLVFAGIWGNNVSHFFTSSLLVWSLALTFNLTLKIDGNYLFYVIAIPLQIMAFIYFIIIKNKKE